MSDTSMIDKLKKYASHASVLYVEDIADVREDTAAILRKFFKVVDTAENGALALDAYGKRGDYDIVITDIKMPEMDGVAMATKIRQINPEQVLVMMTAFYDYQDIRALFDSGFDKFLIKPVNLDNLLAVLSDVSGKVYRRKESLMSNLLAARLSAMNEVLVNVAHHWRQPLNIVGLNVQEIVDSFNHGELTKEHMNEVVDSTMQTIQSMSKTIDKFRQYFKHDTSESCYSADEAVNDAVYIVKDALLANGIELIRDFEPGCMITGKQADLSNVIVEILCNAIEAIANKPPTRPFIKIRIASQDGWVFIAISNNGPLIHDKLLTRISEPYYSSKTIQSGAGLGLYFARMTVEQQMDGVFNCGNADGCVEFSISL
ncbi:MAG: response regulator [Candidatus Magnetominusculus sp. LBB02]|nr:response regulator [Candidatus Magnetominusculus sp. LBB02]